MAVTHCHDDKTFFIVDQQRFLTTIYSNVNETNYRWNSNLFDVQRPFRPTIGDQQKKKKKKSKKRTHDEAFDVDFESAANFCRNSLSNVEQPTNSSQRDYSFDESPLAKIATDQRDRLTSIRQIVLTDYFLRASKLGIQPNIFYTHDKIHPSLVDTSIAGPIFLPSRCRFLWSDMKNIEILVDDPTRYSFIVLDPPWMNKSVRRNRPYEWSDFDQIRNLPIEKLIDRTRPTLICCWSTNCDRVEKFYSQRTFFQMELSTFSDVVLVKSDANGRTRFRFEFER